MEAPQTLQVTCAIICRDARVLAVQRAADNPHRPLRWEFPGGKIEEGESADACIIREIFEELQVEIQILKALPSVTYGYPELSIQLIPFLTCILTGEPILVEHSAVRWLPPARLLELDWSEADRVIVEYIMEDPLLVTQLQSC